MQARCSANSRYEATGACTLEEQTRYRQVCTLIRKAFTSCKRHICFPEHPARCCLPGHHTRCLSKAPLSILHAAAGLNFGLMLKNAWCARRLANRFCSA